MSRPANRLGLGRRLRRAGRLLGLTVLLSGLAAAAAGAGMEPNPPATARAWNELAGRQAEAGDLKAALASFSEAIRLAPRQSALYVNRGLLHMRLRNWEAAESEFSQAVAINPEDARAFLQRAIVRSEMNQNEEAFRDASRAARMEPDNVQMVLVRHQLCSRLGRHDLGHVAGETYIGIRGWGDPMAPYVALLNHVALRRAGDQEGARVILEEAAAWVPQRDWPYAVIAFMQGNLSEESLLAVATGRDHQVLARYYVGVHHWLAGDVAVARSQFEWVVQNGDPALLQHRLAKDHLQELAGGSPAGASKE